MNGLKIIALSFIPIILSIIIIILIKFDSKDNENNCELNILIAILSQRTHFNKRQTLRQTWIQTIDEINKNNLYKSCRIQLKTNFVIGDKECPIHPLFRRTPFSCDFNDIQIKDNNSEIHLFESKQREKQLSVTQTIFRGFSFVIRESVSVTKIGVHKSLLSEDNNNLTIVLLNGRNKDILKRVIISLKTFESNQLLYEDIEPQVLAKDFFGLLLIENNSFKLKLNYSSNLILNRNGFIDILRSYYGFTDYESIGFNSEHFIGVTLTYKSSDENAIRFLLKSETKLQTKWKNQLIKTEKELSNEMSQNKDILLIDSIDVYRNLAEKVLQVIQSAHHFNGLTHLLKTDDDCYLNINNIITYLITNRRLKNVWFGKLWPTDRWGKWAENDYESPLYPPFACGSGYVLSSDLVEWIASNANHLHRFQGEDVSLGIWMSAINPQLVEDKRWVCSDTDFNLSESFAFPQLNEKQIIKIHNFLLKENKTNLI